MEKEQSKARKLFCPVEGKPMQFAIILNKVLQFECLRVLEHIDKQGGEFMGFDPQDSLFINLANRKYKASSNQMVFDIKYVKRCVIEKKLLDLQDFQISGPKLKGPRCLPLQEVWEAKMCQHFKTAEDTLKIIENAE